MYDVSSLQWVIHAAAPCPVELKRAVIEWLGPIVYEYYSSTEVGGTTIDSIAWAEHPGSVGRAWAGAEVQILDDDLNLVPAGEVGNIYFRRRAEFEYRNDPAKTAASRHGDMVTVGDLGRMDAEGYLFIADRRSDLILRGGVNVYPAEIEDVLSRHPDLLDVAVIGVPHPDLGAAVHVIAQPAPGVDLDRLTESLRAYSVANLGSHKRPRTVEFRSEVPRNESGKLLRRVLRDEFDPARARRC